MGKLRTEPKLKPFLSDDEYQHFSQNLKSAQSAARDSHVYWDLEKKENPNFVRKAFLFVADKEGVGVSIRRERGSHSLAFTFKEGGKPFPTRMPAKESKKRILDVLAKAKEPVQKSAIINASEISASTWNLRVKELMEEGKVVREGDRRDTKYRLKK